MFNYILAAFISSILVTGIQGDGIPNCDFFDTVNITDSFSKGFYRYKNVDIPAHLTGEYDYVINSDGGKDPVPKHMRGCVCKLKTCIRFCCHRKKMMEGAVYKECSSHMNATLTYEYINVTLNDGRTVLQKHILNEMIVQDELPLPCKNLYSLDAEQKKDDEWTLFENGTLYRHFDAIHLSKRQYCLQPSASSTGKNYTILTAFNCIKDPPLATAYVKLCSIFFMSLTILAYLWMPKFRSLHGRVCNLYFICLNLTFLLNVLSMFDTFDSKTLCLIIGYAGYFFVISTFMWLSVISFDIWRRLSMRRVKNFYNNGRSTLFKYNAFVWITASTMTIFIMLVDAFVKFDSNNPYTPGVGKFSCWVNTNNWSAMIYFYSPIAILIVLNCAMFCLTSRYIYRENKSNQKELSRIAQQKKTRNRANYRVYLRLFMIMGVSWFLEIISYICDMERVLEFVSTINDIINCSQGMIVFLATFCNMDMINSITNCTKTRESTATDFSSGSRPQETERPARN